MELSELTLGDYRRVLNNLTASEDFYGLDDDQKQEAIKGQMGSFMRNRPDIDPAEVQAITEAENKRFLRNTGRGRVVPTAFLQENNIIFPNQEAGFKDLSKDEQQQKIDEFRIKIPEIAALNPTQKDDTEFFLNQSARQLERRVNGEDVGWVPDKAKRVAEGMLSTLAEYTGMPGVADSIQDYFHENPNMDQDFTAQLAQGLGSAGSSIAIMVGLAATTKGLGGSAVMADIIATGGILGGNTVLRYNEAYQKAIDLGLDDAKATEAAVSTWPAAIIDTMADKLLASKLMPKAVTKVFEEGTNAAKKAMVAKVLSEQTLKHKLLDYSIAAVGEGVEEAAGDYVAGYRPYLVTGEDDFIPTDQELASSFMVGAVLGAGINAAIDIPNLLGEKQGQDRQVTNDDGTETTVREKYFTQTGRNVGETKKNLDSIPPDQQEEVWKLMSEGKYQQAYQLSNAILNPPEATESTDSTEAPEEAPEEDDEQLDDGSPMAEMLKRKRAKAAAAAAVSTNQPASTPAASTPAATSTTNTSATAPASAAATAPTTAPAAQPVASPMDLSTEDGVIKAMNEAGHMVDKSSSRVAAVKQWFSEGGIERVLRKSQQQIDLLNADQAKGVNFNRQMIIEGWVSLINNINSQPATAAAQPAAQPAATQAESTEQAKAEAAVEPEEEDLLVKEVRESIASTGEVPASMTAGPIGQALRYVKEQYGDTPENKAKFHKVIDAYSNPTNPKDANSWRQAVVDVYGVKESKASKDAKKKRAAANKDLRENGGMPESKKETTEKEEAKKEPAKKKAKKESSQATKDEEGATREQQILSYRNQSIPAKEYLNNFIADLRLKLSKERKSSVKEQLKQNIIAVEQMLVDIGKKHPNLRFVNVDIPGIDGAYHQGVAYINNPTVKAIGHETAHALTDADVHLHITNRTKNSKGKKITTYKEKLLAALEDPTVPEYFKTLIGAYIESAMAMGHTEHVGMVVTASNISNAPSVASGAYAFTTIQEFIAETYGSASFQEKLAQIPYKGSTIWETIVDAMQKAFEWMQAIGGWEVMRATDENVLNSALIAINQIINSGNNINEGLVDDVAQPLQQTAPAAQPAEQQQESESQSMPEAATMINDYTQSVQEVVAVIPADIQQQILAELPQVQAENVVGNAPQQATDPIQLKRIEEAFLGWLEGTAQFSDKLNKIFLDIVKSTSNGMVKSFYAVEHGLNAAEKTLAATYMKAASWSRNVSMAFNNQMTEWVVSGKSAIKELVKLFQKIVKTMKNIIMVGTAAISISQDTLPEAYKPQPIPTENNINDFPIVTKIIDTSYNPNAIQGAPAETGGAPGMVQTGIEEDEFGNIIPDPTATIEQPGAIAEPKQDRYPVVTELSEDLDSWFKEHPHVTGMAIGAGMNDTPADMPRKIALNPYSGLNEQQKAALVINEGLRHFMDETKPVLDFEPTQAQKDFFAGEEYGKPENVRFLRETIVARIITGDESAGEVTPEQEAAAAKVWEAFNGNKYGNRPDGTQKGNGFFGELKLSDGGVATEYSTQSNAVKINGERIDFPTLVPTLTRAEVDVMRNDIIPNRKPIPEAIMQKAINHAKKRISEGKSVFADNTEAQPITQPTIDSGNTVIHKDTRTVAQWILNNNDSAGLPFAISNKINGDVAFFNLDGKLEHKFPSLYGRNIGDITLGIKAPVHRTPSGRFKAEFIRSEDYWGAFKFNHDPDGYNHLMHRVPLHSRTMSKVERYNRLKSSSPVDNRASSGCINLMRDDMIVITQEYRDGFILYVLPETEEGRATFKGEGGQTIAFRPYEENNINDSRQVNPDSAILESDNFRLDLNGEIVFLPSQKTKRLNLHGTAEIFVNNYENEIEWNSVFNKKGLEAQHAEFYRQALEIPAKKMTDEFIAKKSESNLRKYLEGLANRDNLVGEAQAAADAFLANPDAAAKSLSEDLRSKREAGMKLWRDQLAKDDTYTSDPFFTAYVWNSITARMSKTNTNGTPGFDAAVLKRTHDHLSSQYDLDKFNEAYEKIALEMALENASDRDSVTLPNMDVWIKIPRTRENDADWDKNLSLLQTLSLQDWCTSGPQASVDYLQKGDFWMLASESQIRMAIRFEDTNVAEIQGPENNGSIPALYADRVVGLVNSGSIVLKRDQKISLNKAIAKAEDIKHVKTMEPIDAMAYLGLNPERLEDGSISLNSTLFSNHIEYELDLSEVSSMVGNVDGSFKLPNIQTISGRMYVRVNSSYPKLEAVDAIKNDNAKKIDLPSLTYARYADMRNSSAPNLARVDDLHIDKNTIIKDLKEVGAIEAEEGSSLDSLERLSRPNLSSLIRDNCSFKNLRSSYDITVGRNVDLPLLETVDGELSTGSSLPSLKYVTNLASHRNENEFIKLETSFAIRGAGSFPSLVECGHIDLDSYYDDTSKVPLLKTVNTNCTLHGANDRIEALSLTHVGGHLDAKMLYAPLLEHVGGSAAVDMSYIPNLKTVGGPLIIMSNNQSIVRSKTWIEFNYDHEKAPEVRALMELHGPTNVYLHADTLNPIISNTNKVETLGEPDLNLDLSDVESVNNNGNFVFRPSEESELSEQDQRRANSIAREREVDRLSRIRVDMTRALKFLDVAKRAREVLSDPDQVIKERMESAARLVGELPTDLDEAYNLISSRVENVTANEESLVALRGDNTVDPASLINQINNISFLPDERKQKNAKYKSQLKRMARIRAGNVNDKQDARTQKMIELIADIKNSDLSLVAEDVKEHFLELVDNIYNSRTVRVTQPDIRLDSDEVIKQIEIVKKAIDAAAIANMIESYDDLINFDDLNIDLDDKAAVAEAVNDYMEKNKALDMFADQSKSEKAKARMEKVYVAWRKKFGEIVQVVKDMYPDAKTYLAEMENIHGSKITSPELRTFLQAHYEYLTTIDVSQMKGRELYNHFFAINNISDGSFNGMKVTVNFIAQNRNSSEKVINLKNKFKDAVSKNSKIMQALSQVNMLAELHQVQLSRLSTLRETQEWLQNKFMGNLYNAIVTTSYNRKTAYMNDFIKEREKFEKALGRETNTEDRVVISMVGRLVQYAVGENPDKAFIRNKRKEKESIDHILAAGNFEDNKFTRTRILALYDSLIKGIPAEGGMAAFLDTMDERMGGTEGLKVGRERRKLLGVQQEIFSRFNLESKIISEGLHGQPFIQQYMYISNEVFTTDTDGRADKINITDPLPEWTTHENKSGVRSKASHYMERKGNLGEKDYYSYNHESAIGRNIERIAVDNATIVERFVIAQRLKKGSELNKIISQDESGVFHPERVEFLLNSAITLVKNATSRGAPFNPAVSAIRAVTSAYAKPTLSSIHHIISQPIGALFDYGIRNKNFNGWLSVAAYYASNVSKANQWLSDNSQWTAQRLGTDTEALDQRRMPLDDQAKGFLNSPFMKYLSKLYGGASKIMTFFMHHGDNFSAKVTILAEYERLLEQKYGRAMRFDDPSLKTVDGNLLTQATLNSELTVNTSNKILRGEFFTDRKTSMTLVRSLLFAFSAHQSNLATQLNKAMRELNDLRKLKAPSGEIESKVRTIAAIVSQQLVFTTARFYIGAGAAYLMIQAVRDYYDDDEGKIQELASKLEVARRQKDKVKIAHAESELKNGKTVRDIVLKQIHSTRSPDSLFKQIIRDGTGSFHIALNNSAATKAIFFIPDKWCEASAKAGRNALLGEIDAKIKDAKEKHNINAVARLTEERMVISASEYIPFQFDNTTGFGMGGIYGSVLDSYGRVASEANDAIMGAKEWSWNDFIITAAGTVAGQAEVTKYMKLLDKIEDEVWTENQAFQNQKLPKAKEEAAGRR